MGLDNVFAFGALAILVLVVIRGRRRVHCLEAQLKANSSQQQRKKARQQIDDHRALKLVDLCREMEARVQYKAILLEALIDDADNRIDRCLNSEKGRQLALSDPSFKKEFCAAVDNNQTDEELSQRFNKPHLIITLLREMWRPLP